MNHFQTYGWVPCLPSFSPHHSHPAILTLRLSSRLYGTASEPAGTPAPATPTTPAPVEPGEGALLDPGCWSLKSTALRVVCVCCLLSYHHLEEGKKLIAVGRKYSSRRGASAVPVCARQFTGTIVVELGNMQVLLWA